MTAASDALNHLWALEWEERQLRAGCLGSQSHTHSCEGGYGGVREDA
ncbi:hypothetical protein Cadr_000027047 [Camelus dromedarius]|uniref:Uncharacterized protein n=1 Tax=Camelus dromedarius TaxID=9838 RepID=A0A5N4C4L8_CAMDR|nr:hypothetical protein Cadr_000027047 [Camelus dromedarius]